MNRKGFSVIGFCLVVVVGLAMACLMLFENESATNRVKSNRIQTQYTLESAVELQKYILLDSIKNSFREPLELDCTTFSGIDGYVVNSPSSISIEILSKITTFGSIEAQTKKLLNDGAGSSITKKAKSVINDMKIAQSITTQAGFYQFPTSTATAVSFEQLFNIPIFTAADLTPNTVTMASIKVQTIIKYNVLTLNTVTEFSNAIASITLIDDDKLKFDIDFTNAQTKLIYFSYNR